MVRAAQNRWAIAAAAVAFHLMIGSAYAWSVFTKPLMANWDGARKRCPLRLASPSLRWACRPRSWDGLSNAMARGNPERWLPSSSGRAWPDPAWPLP